MAVDEAECVDRMAKVGTAARNKSTRRASFHPEPEAAAREND